MQTQQIVNNESAEILRMFNSEFQDCASNRGLDLYPKEQRTQIDELNDWIYPGINNGVYRCGFATKQATYSDAFKELFAALDRAEEVLGSSRYLTGSELTEADVRLFTTLVRFDAVYVAHFKCNLRRIIDYPNLWATRGTSIRRRASRKRSRWDISRPTTSYRIGRSIHQGSSPMDPPSILNRLMDGADGIAPE